MIQTALLQWGRDVSIPEMRTFPAASVMIAGFNGAGMFPSQKYGLVGQPFL